MQVKKFEARTMKEALEMVKTQLGPDAIILSARDNARSFGLVGEGSVEITAAVSEETLQKKRFVESRLREQEREKFLKSPARVQRTVMDKMVNKYIEEKSPRNFTRTRYAEIADEMHGMDMVSEEDSFSNKAQERIKEAAQRAREAFGGSSVVTKNAERASTNLVKQQNLSSRSQYVEREHEHQNQNGTSRVALKQDSAEITALKNEIASLKNVITQFKTIPQSFAGTHPGADLGVSYDLSFMFEKLTSVGISNENAAEILGICSQAMPAIKLKNKNLVEAWTARYILETTQVVGPRNEPKVQLFVGPSGSGKTSSLVKFASHLVINEGKKVALLTTDTLKVGAAEQLKIYAQILNVPFAIIRTQMDWASVARQLNLVDYVLVDYPGVSLKNLDEITTLKHLMPPDVLKAETHLVLNATSKDQDATEIGKRYQMINYKNVIFTAVDESTQHGTIYNFMKNFNIPLHSFGIGNRVPEDFEIATRERLLDLIFKITKVQRAG